MKAIRTVKIKFNGSTKADVFMSTWLCAANWLSEIVFNTKELNSNRLAKAYYTNLREKGLSSQLACSLCKTVCATYKTAKSNNKWKKAIFRNFAMPVVWKRDFNKTRKGVTLWGEVLTIKDSRPLPDSAWKDSNLKRVGNQWYLLLFYEIETKETNSIGGIVGVDMGIKRMLVATNSNNNKTFFFHGGELNHRRSCIRRTRATVQSVATRSSRRLLRRMAQREGRITGHLLHVASKALVSYAVEVGARKIVVENLENIRDSSLSKGRDMRSKVHRWPYADMRFKIKYKALAVGIEMEVVSPRNTSLCCTLCGHISKSNRKGLHFECKACGHKDDADRLASKNIRARSVAIASNAMATGSLKVPQKLGTVDTASESCVLHGDLVVV